MSTRWKRWGLRALTVLFAGGIVTGGLAYAGYQSAKDRDDWPSARIVTRFVDEQGESLAGVRLSATGFHDRFDFFTDYVPFVESLLPSCVSDRDGWATLHLEVPRFEPRELAEQIMARILGKSKLENVKIPIRVTATGRGGIHRGWVKIKVGETTFLPETELRRSATIEGRVMDRDGSPVSDAWVYGCVPGISWGSAWTCWTSTRSDSRGLYRMEVAAGPVRLRAMAPDFDAGPFVLHELVPEEHLVSVDLVVGDPREEPEENEEGRALGRVTDEEGDPVEGATVAMLSERQRYEVATDSSGEFSGRQGWLGFSDVDGVVLVVGPDRLAMVARSVAEVRELSAGGCTIVLPQPDKGRLRIVSDSGEDVPEAEVDLLVDVGEKSWPLFPPLREIESGTITLPRVPMPHRLRVWAPGWQETTVGPFPPGQPDETRTVVLHRGGFVEGVVRDGEDAVPGARVLLEPRTVWRKDSAGIHVNRHTPARVETTDAEGRFTSYFRGENRRFDVRVTADGFADTALLDVEVSQSLRNPTIHVEMTRGGVIAGRVLAPPGRSVVGMWAQLMRTETRSDAKVCLGPDGRFEFRDVEAGEWRVVVIPPSESSFPKWSRAWRHEARATPVPLSLSEGERVEVDLDLVPRTLPISLRMKIDGELPGPWVVRSRVFRDGALDLHLPERSPLICRELAGNPGLGLVVECLDESLLDLDLRTASVTGRIRRECTNGLFSYGSNPLTFVVRVDPHTAFFRTLEGEELEEDGSFFLTNVPAGLVQVVHGFRTGDLSRAKLVKELDLVPGEHHDLAEIPWGGWHTSCRPGSCSW